MNRILLIIRSVSSAKVKEALERFGRTNRLHRVWEISGDLPPLMDEEDISLPEMNDIDVILSYTLHPDINYFLVEQLKSSSTEKVLLMPHDHAPLPPGYHVYGNLLVGVLNPCCIIPPFKNSILSEFRKEFGTPAFHIEVKDRVITDITVITHTRCGAANFVAEHLVGIPVDESYTKAGLLTQYHCQSSGGPSGSIHTAGKIHAEAVKKALSE